MVAAVLAATVGQATQPRPSAAEAAVFAEMAAIVTVTVAEVAAAEGFAPKAAPAKMAQTVFAPAAEAAVFLQMAAIVDHITPYPLQIGEGNPPAEVAAAETLAVLRKAEHPTEQMEAVAGMEW